MQLRIDELKGGSTARTVEGFRTGQATGSNVIIIQVEALQAAAIGAKMGGAEVTPNLNRLIERSWYFPNHMSGIGRGTTADAEFLTNTSLYPPYAGAASLMYADRELPSLPRLLRSQGYTAQTFHTNSVQYWNRSQLYPAIGFDRYFDDTFFGSAGQDRIRRVGPRPVQQDARGPQAAARDGQAVLRPDRHDVVALPVHRGARSTSARSSRSAPTWGRSRATT